MQPDLEGGFTRCNLVIESLDPIADRSRCSSPEHPCRCDGLIAGRGSAACSSQAARGVQP